MRRVGISIFLLLSLSITISLFAGPANCQVETVTIRFQGRVAGDCILFRGSPVDSPLPSPIEWWGYAEGTAGISGLAQAVLFQIGTPYGNTYDSENLKATGTVTLTWTEGENKHLLVAKLGSTENTRGVFAPDTDFFTLPVGGDSPVKALTFKGVHISDQGSQKVEGVSLLGITPSILPPPANIPGALMILIDEVEQKMYTIVWLPQEAEIPFGPGGPMIPVPAARVLQSTVNIIGRP
jgi:hypothetical protein